jgi:serine-type D-Ala-D-Ala carboxypeptidase/endopeptidase
MRRCLCVLALLASFAAQAAEPPPFSSEAARLAATLPQGAVATAEKREHRWYFAIAGQPFAAGHAAVPAERVLFEIGSISKVFTGILLADAIGEGRLRLDDALAQRLPVKFQHAETGAVTIKQLATHTSCLPRMPDNMVEAASADPYARYDRKALFEYLASAALGGKPPCAAAYSNLGFGILGTVLEVAYGKPWAALVEEKITAPLGMADTVQALSPEQQARLAKPWDGGNAAHEWSFQAIAGAGALHSTAADMSKFADALLAGAKGPLGAAWPMLAGDYADMPAVGGKIGLALMHIPAVAGSGAADHYEHDGGTGGYRSLVEVWPRDDRATVILASNAAAAPGAWLARWRTAAETPIKDEEIVLPAASLDGYTGVYTIDAQSRFTIVRHGDALLARLSGQTFLPIFARSKDEFFYKVVNAHLEFHRDASGSVDRLTLRQNGREIPAVRDAAPPPHIEFPSAAALAAYVGDYDFAAFMPSTKISVSLHGDVLLVMLSGQPALPVFAVAKDRFDYEVVAASLSFERDAEGKVTALVLHQNGRDMKAPRL